MLVSFVVIAPATNVRLNDCNHGTNSRKQVASTFFFLGWGETGLYFLVVVATASGDDARWDKHKYYCRMNNALIKLVHKATIAAQILEKMLSSQNFLCKYQDDAIFSCGWFLIIHNQDCSMFHLEIKKEVQKCKSKLAIWWFVGRKVM